MAQQPISDKQGDHNKSDESSKKKRTSRDNKYRRLRKRNKVSLFISVISLFVAAVLFSIAIAVWQKGHLWPAFYWGIAAYVVLGFAIFFSYHAYVIEPSTRDSTGIDRPYVIIRKAALAAPLAAGKAPKVELTMENISKTEAVDVEVWDLTFMYTPEMGLSSFEYVQSPHITYEMAPTDKW